MHRRQWIAFTVAAAAAGSVFAQGYPTTVSYTHLTLPTSDLV